MCMHAIPDITDCRCRFAYCVIRHMFLRFTVPPNLLCTLCEPGMPSQHHSSVAPVPSRTSGRPPRVLQVLQRLLHNEAFKQYAPSLCDALLGVLECDNAENGQLALKATITLHRSYHKMAVQPPLDQKALRFLEVVIEVRRGLRHQVLPNSSQYQATMRVCSALCCQPAAVQACLLLASAACSPPLCLLCVATACFAPRTCCA